MSQGCTLLILGSKCQDHGASVIENSFRTITVPVSHLWSWNSIHLLLVSQGWALLILGSKGQGHGALVIENCFRTITDYVIHLCTLAPHESRMCPIGFGVQRSKSLGICDWKWFPDHNWLCNPPETPYTCHLWVKDVPYCFGGQTSWAIWHWK